MSGEIPNHLRKRLRIFLRRGRRSSFIRATESQTEESSEERDDADSRPRLAGRSFRATDFVLEIEDGFCGAVVNLLESARQGKRIAAQQNRIARGTLGYA